MSRALPRALAALGNRVSVFAPFYQVVRRRGIDAEPVATVDVPGYGSGFRVFRAPRAAAPAELYLIEHIGSDELLLFSTDYPHWHFDGEAVLPEGLGDALIRRILVDNPLAAYPRLSAQISVRPSQSEEPVR